MRFFTAFILLTVQSVAFALQLLPLQTALSLEDSMASCNCRGINPTTKKLRRHICNNASLGPQTLPWRFPMLSLVNNYDRFGGLTPRQFLNKWRKPGGGWRFPDKDGFQLDLDGKPIKGQVQLPAGFKVDRFGQESGKYVAAVDAPFSQRSLPPDSLNVCRPKDKNCNPADHPWNYHIYEVIDELTVEAGPVAPAFGQPGGGVQYFLGDSIANFVARGHLKKLKLGDIHLGPGWASCGRSPADCECQQPE